MTSQTRWSNRLWVRGGVAVGLVAAVSTFGSIVNGPQWWLWTTGLIAVIAMIGVVVTQSVVRLLLQLVVVVVALSLQVEPARWTEVAREAASIIWLEAPPVLSSVPILAVMLVGFGVLAVFLDVVAESRGAPWWFGLAMVAIVSIPTVLLAMMPPAWLLAIMAATWLVVLWAHHDSTQVDGEQADSEQVGPNWRRALVTTSVVVAAAAVAFPAVPAPQARIWNVVDHAPGAFGTGVNPMLELGQDLQRGADRQVLEYTSTRSSASYLKLATLTDFSGDSWEPQEFPTSGGQADELATGETSAHSLDIGILELNSRRVPLPPFATTIAGLGEWWTWMRPGGTAQLASGTLNGREYRVDFEVPDVSLEQMRAATTRERVDVSMLRLPGSEALSQIQAVAQEVTADATTDYDRALTLQNWFRSEFDYSVTTPVTENYDGNGFEHVVTFLEKRSGYCVHFASAMAIMGRTVGLPTRVAVGYAPADSMTIRDGSRTWVNRSHDAHAWVEVHFDEIGWVQFDPTASIGSPTSFTSELDEESDPDAPEATPTTEAPAPDVPEDVDTDDVDADQPTGSSGSWWWLAALVLMMAAPVVTRIVLRRMRGAGALDVWRETTDTARDLGIELPAAFTIGETAATLVAAGAPADEVEKLALAVERARYGTEPSVVEFDARSILAALRNAARPADRIAATFAPRSLLSTLGRRFSRDRAPSSTTRAQGRPGSPGWD